MNIKDLALKRIRNRSIEKAGFLVSEFARAASEEKESILAALEFEKWLAESCGEVLADTAPELL